MLNEEKAITSITLITKVNPNPTSEKVNFSQEGMVVLCSCLYNQHFSAPKGFLQEVIVVIKEEEIDCITWSFDMRGV